LGVSQQGSTGKDAKGATVIFWRLAGGGEDELHFGFCCWNLLPSFFFFGDICGGLCRWPPNTFLRKWTTMVDELTLNFTVILHGTTQTHCFILPKVTNNALITVNNVSCLFFRSFTIVSFQSCPQSTARFTQHFQRENNT